MIVSAIKMALRFTNNSFVGLGYERILESRIRKMLRPPEILR